MDICKLYKVATEIVHKLKPYCGRKPTEPTEKEKRFLAAHVTLWEQMLDDAFGK